ncbi:PEX5 [Symbiodinium necroappetens]|uniref:PEX5 protein n=1 Tax=Symbiodinium necroappetens TaxID=1628268 RepID=A0A812XPR3_9DINO|nr:PEX5 [Symbiodinium necroappetens]
MPATAVHGDSFRAERVPRLLDKGHGGRDKSRPPGALLQIWRAVRLLCPAWQQGHSLCQLQGVLRGRATQGFVGCSPPAARGEVPRSGTSAGVQRRWGCSQRYSLYMASSRVLLPPLEGGGGCNAFNGAPGGCDLGSFGGFGGAPCNGCGFSDFSMMQGFQNGFQAGANQQSFGAPAFAQGGFVPQGIPGGFPVQDGMGQFQASQLQTQQGLGFANFGGGCQQPMGQADYGAFQHPQAERPTPIMTTGGTADPAERLASAQKLREEGNAKFKEQDLGRRIITGHSQVLLICIAACTHGAVQQCSQSGAALNSSWWKQALRLTQFKEVPEGLGEDLVALRRPTQLNLALVCLRSDPTEPFRALELCEEVLDAEPDNPKATYRKAKALMELGEQKEAEFELVRACKLMPKDASVRKELEALRQSFRNEKAKEVATFQGLFEKSPGFASDNRKNETQKLSKADVDDIYFHDGKENPYEAADNPQELAKEFQASGKLEDAAQAWEAMDGNAFPVVPFSQVAMGQTASNEDWQQSHLTYALEYGALLMDINIDRLALRCFSTAFERPAQDDEAERALARVRQHALLLKSICLLNEAAEDPQAEITECLEKWLSAAHPGPSEEALQERLLRLRSEQGGSASADVAVALGLLQLLQGQEGLFKSLSVASTFASALLAPEDDTYFGAPRRRATRWNMLGAVLANRGRPEDAVCAYRWALYWQPHYPRALINLAMAELKRGGFLEAAAAQAAAIASSPSWACGELWAQLEKEALAQTSIDDLAEAVQARHIARVRELLAPHSDNLDTSSMPATSPAEVLKEMKLVE